MENAIPYVLKVAAAAASIVGMILFYTLTKKVLDGLGTGGRALSGKLSSTGENARKKAGEFADYNKNLRKSAALSGGKTFGGGRFRRQHRRDLRNQAADAAVQSGQAQFNVSDPKSAAYAQSIAQSQHQAKFLGSAANAGYVGALAKNPSSLTQGMNPDVVKNDEVQKAINTQQERAIADAIKDVELSADIPPGSPGITKMGDMLKDALRDGDSITARAMQNMLLQSGDKGIDKYRDAVNGAAPANPSDPASQAAFDNATSALRSNVLRNHGNIKGSAADVMEHAIQGGSLAAKSADAGTWSKLNDSEVSSQKLSSLKMAQAAGGISKEQAERILDTPETSKNLAPDARTIIKTIAGRP